MGNLSSILLGPQTTARQPFDSVFQTEWTVAGNIAAGAVSATVYTVPAATMIIISDMSLLVYVSNVSVNGSGGIAINQAAIGTSYVIQTGVSTDASTTYAYANEKINLQFPMTLYAGDTIFISKVTNDVRVDYFIHGYSIVKDM